MNPAVTGAPSADSSFIGEAEAYALLAHTGFRPPRHGVLGQTLPFTTGEPVVLKGLGENLWHKSEIGAVEFLAFDPATLAANAAAMRTRVEAAGHRWLDALVCERIAIARAEGLPSEGFVSLARGEAGWVVLCGFGGLQAEALATLAPPLRWPLSVTQPLDALEEFKRHPLGRIWLGELRGTSALTTAQKLGDFLVELWQLAMLADAEGLDLLEMNPVVLDPNGQPRPLDAVGRHCFPPSVRLRPPGDFLTPLRQPSRVALAGVSEKPGGVGRTILANLQRCPSLAGRILILKPDLSELFGCPCVPNVSALRKTPVDLLLLALPAPIAAQVLTDLIKQGGGARVVGLVSGGIGDGADQLELGPRLSQLLQETRADGRWTPVVLGPNFLGHWVPATQLDTSFIPADKLKLPIRSVGELVLLSQSGAFLLCRRSRAPQLRFSLGVALGNQMDAALPDFLSALADDPQCRAVAAYVEGFGSGHLQETALAAAQLRQQGVQLLMHRAGRTNAGQAAAASHTGAMAGDYELEYELLHRAGVKFSHSIAAFDAALEWLGAWPAMTPGPVALLTNSGFESVNGSDLLAGGRLQAATLSSVAKADLLQVLAAHKLEGLVVPQLPLDLTPMANEAAFVAAADILMGTAGALVIGLVPFTKLLDTAPAAAAPFAMVLAKLRDHHDKPVAVVVDAGTDYESYREVFRAAGLPVFDRVETALLGLHTLA